MSKLPVPTAKDINEAHALARGAAETAVQYAVKCGEMLARKKASLPRGEFDGWVQQWCDFGRSSAYAYLKVAANSSRALDDWKSINQALGYESKPKPAKAESKPAQQRPADPPPADAPDWSAPPAPPPPPAAKPALVSEAANEPEPPLPDWTADDEAEQIRRAEAEYAESIEKVMQADDRLAAAHAEIKRQAAEIAALKISRDGLQNRCGELVRMLKKEQATVARLRAVK